MFTVRNYVIAGKENSGGSLGLCLPLPADFVFPEALNMWLCAHSLQGMRSWDSPCLGDL